MNNTPFAIFSFGQSGIVPISPEYSSIGRVYCGCDKKDNRYGEMTRRNKKWRY